MKILVNVILVVGFCLGTAGAAGFHRPVEPLPEDGTEPAPAPPAGLLETEPWAKEMFAGGLLLVLAGGFVSRSQRKSELESSTSGSGGLKQFLAEELAVIRDIVVELDAKKAELSSEEMRARIDALLANEYFDLASRNEEIAAAIGFSDYARVWEGVATAERLLARVWSLGTDGFHEEGIEELPRARALLEESASVAASL